MGYYGHDANYQGTVPGRGVFFLFVLFFYFQIMITSIKRRRGGDCNGIENNGSPTMDGEVRKAFQRW